MKRLKQKLNSAIHRHPWAFQTALAILLAVCAVGFAVNRGLAAESDWPWQDKLPPEYPMEGQLVDIGVVDSQDADNTTSFLVGEDVQIKWELKAGQDYTNWTVDLYLLMAEKDGNPSGEENNKLNNVLYPIDYNIPAGNLKYDWTPTIDRFDSSALDPTSLTSLPNPFDRHIFAVLVDNNLSIYLNRAMAWNVTPAFNIVPWRITAPTGGTLQEGEIVTVSWATNLTGAGRLYLEVNKSVETASNCLIIDGRTNCWIVKEVLLESKTISWKVGYSQETVGGAWTKLDSQLFGANAHLYLASFYYVSPYPDHYYFGHDYDATTTDQQLAFTIQGIPLPVGTDPDNPVVYTSPPLDLDSPSSLDLLDIAYEQETSQSDVDFAIGLFKTDGSQVGEYYQIGEELEAPSITLPTELSNSLADVSSVRFRITMSSIDLNLYKPSVTSITLSYTSTPPINNSVSLSITPATNNAVKSGASAVYTVTVTRVPAFVGTVALSSNIAAIFGTGVTASFNPTQISFALNDPLTKTSLLSVTASDTATATSAKTFTVIGTITDQPDATATASLAVLDATTTDTITLDLTIPVEEVSPATFMGSLAHPLFTLRLYNPTTNTKVYEKPSFVGTISTDKTKYTKVITIPRTELSSSAYSVYIRSDRHLWGKSVTDITIDDTNDIYGITFPTLKAGNITEDNKINMDDFTTISPYYGQTIANLLGDLNNDGEVNMSDLTWIVRNYGLCGLPLSCETT